MLHPRAGANPRRPGRELLLTFAFRCNFACRFCYVEDGLGGRFRGVTLDEARRLLADPALTAGVTRIVLSGGEVTLDKDLPRFAELARAVPSVEHVRIQTNASRLDDRALVARLTAAGVDEFFVSLHGADAATCDAITAVPGSLAAIEAGLASLAEVGATVVTNTVVCAANVAQLDAIVALAHAHGAGAAELWGYVPRVDAADARAQLVRVTDAAPHVQRAVAAGLARGLAMTVKYFPRCLLGELAHVHSDAQPRLIIDDAFWQDYPTYGCLFEGVCADAAADDGCSGLADAYVRRFGWEEDALRPRGAPDDIDAAPIARYHAWDDRPHAEPAARALDLTRWALAPGADVGGFRLDAATRADAAIRLVFVDDRGPVAIDLHPHDPARACFARTPTIDLTHPPLPDATTARARPLFAALAAHLRARDDGALARELFAASRLDTATTPAALVAPVELLPTAWPGVDDPRAAALLAAAAALVTLDQLAAREVEPSVVLGAPERLRLLVNPSVAGPGRDRPAIAARLLTAAGAPAWLADVAEAWLRDPARTAFVGVELAPAAPPRHKLYLDTRAAPDRAAAARALGGPPPAAATALIAIDVVDDRPLGFKHYAPITAAAARVACAGPLIDLLEARGLLLGELPLLIATRFAADGAVRDRALHVDVARFAHLALGPAWARAAGDAAAADRIAASGRAARVVSATSGADGGRHVYLGGPP
ncbi:MAG: radical SAM protein [Myxococcales bacterium]|nr:radical SAM protein [Myxococcales bacterium]